MKVSMIACMSEDGVIGVDGKIPWRHPLDMAFFRALTADKMVVCGRKTFESLFKGGVPKEGPSPLPGRRIVVLASKPIGYRGTGQMLMGGAGPVDPSPAWQLLGWDNVINPLRSPVQGVEVFRPIAPSPEGRAGWYDVVSMAGARGVEELFVIGGREVYREFIPCVDRVYLTVLDGLRFDFFDIAPARFPFGLPELEARFTGHDRISLHGDQPATLHIFRGRK